MKLIDFSDDFQTFQEWNEELIYYKAQEEMYVDWWYLDDYDPSNIEVPQWKFESVAESLFQWVMDYPVYYLDKMVNRPEHFYNLTKEDYEKSKKTNKNC